MWEIDARFIYSFSSGKALIFSVFSFTTSSVCLRVSDFRFKVTVCFFFEIRLADWKEIHNRKQNKVEQNDDDVEIEFLFWCDRCRRNSLRLFWVFSLFLLLFEYKSNSRENFIYSYMICFVCGTVFCLHSPRYKYSG